MKPKDLIHRASSNLAAQLVRLAYFLNRNATNGQFKRLIGATEYLEAQKEATNNARALFSLPTKEDASRDKEALVRLVSGCLRGAIHNHGPITKIKIGNAAVQIAGELHAHRFRP